MTEKAMIMARIYEPLDKYRHGKLVAEPQSNDTLVHVYFVPSLERLEHSGLSFDDPSEHRVKLLEIDVQEGRLTMLPTNTLGNHERFLKPKYRQVRRITLDGATPALTPVDGETSSTGQYSQTVTFGAIEPLTEDIDHSRILDAPSTSDQIMQILEDLPSGFTKDYDYGLGLAMPYRFVVLAVEELSDCTELLISHHRATLMDNKGDQFIISNTDFTRMLKELGRVSSLGKAAVQSVKLAETQNFLAERVGEPSIPIKTGRDPLRKLLTNSVRDGGRRLSSEQQDELIGVTAQNVESLVATKPESIARLKDDIELVGLELLIDRFEQMMTAKLREQRWQQFLEENPFMLGLAFGYPVLKVQDKASVGGRKLTGGGDTFTDFLVKNSLTDNTAIIEIKTPGTKLLNEGAYRNEVYSPSAELSGAVNQSLNQKHKFEREIAQFKENSGISDIRSYAVHCCLIIGTMPETNDRIKCFELYRGNSKDVQILTFDELLQKLRNLRNFLKSSESASERIISESQAEMPF